MIAVAAAYGRIQQSCKVCTIDAEETRSLRRLWACDETATHEVARIPCPWCVGDGCERCGDGTIGLRDCPQRLLRETAGIGVALRASAMIERGLLPVAGGYADQSATLLAAVSIVDAAKSWYLDREQEDADGGGS